MEKAVDLKACEELRDAALAAVQVLRNVAGQVTGGPECLADLDAARNDFEEWLIAFAERLNAVDAADAAPAGPTGPLVPLDVTALTLGPGGRRVWLEAE